MKFYRLKHKPTGKYFRARGNSSKMNNQLDTVGTNYKNKPSKGYLGFSKRSNVVKLKNGWAKGVPSWKREGQLYLTTTLDEWEIEVCTQVVLETIELA